MCSRSGHIALWGCALIVAASGCGGQTSEAVVARVGDSTISKAALEHWTAVQAVTDYESIPKRSVPAGIVPDPPRFAACIARLRVAPPPGTARIAGRDQLKTTCERNYAVLRAHVLTVLITFRWLAAESAVHRVKVTDSEVKEAFAHYRDEQFPILEAYARFLKATGQTLADEWLRERMDLYSTKLDKLAITEKNGHLIAGFAQRWAKKTTCSPGYVVPNCKEYHGREPPEARL